MKRVHLMKACGYACVAACIGGCIAGYNPPREQKQIYEVKVNATKDRIYAVAKHALRKSGYRFAFADKDEGRITTRPRTLQLTGRECDCGSGIGKGFASESQTTTDVSYFIIARHDGFSLRTIIEGQYVASDTSMVKRFQCVSRGVLEKEMIDKITAMLEESEAASEPAARSLPPMEPVPAAEPEPAIEPVPATNPEPAAEPAPEAETAPVPAQ